MTCEQKSSKNLILGRKKTSNFTENLLIDNKYKRKLLFKTRDLKFFIFK